MYLYSPFRFVGLHIVKELGFVFCFLIKVLKITIEYSGDNDSDKGTGVANSSRVQQVCPQKQPQIVLCLRWHWNFRTSQFHF